MLRARRAPWVTYHNIVGVVRKSNWFGGEAELSDGVVGVQSAHMDDVASEILVEAKHQDIHSKPRAILEVRSILVEHLHQVSMQPALAKILDVPEWNTNGQRRSKEEGVEWASSLTTSPNLQKSATLPVHNNGSALNSINSNVAIPTIEGNLPPVVKPEAFAPLPFPPKMSKKLRLAPIYNITR